MVCFALPRASDPAGRVRVWDLPTRLCHWALALCVAGAFVTQWVEAMAWHGRFGLAILGLVVFRILWGFFGSTYARFANFVRGPGAIRAYLAAAKSGVWQGFGHNPLGALSVLALLAILATMAGTGIFANDDVSFTGPLFDLVGKTLSDRLTHVHELGEKLLLALVGLHIAAIAFHVRVKKNNLVKPMVTGWQEGSGESARGGGLVAFLVAAVIAVGAVWAASGALLPAAAAPTAVAAAAR